MTLKQASRLDDEEARVHAFDVDRRRHGVYFTPAPLVQRVLERVGRYLSPGRPFSLLDPACGAGAFLAGAAERFPEASLHGLELDPQVAQSTRERLPSARIRVGNALEGGLEPLVASLPAGLPEVWVGNPPYNGTSPVLQRPEAYARLRAMLPSRFQLPPGTSLRDDFAFFLLLAAERLRTRDGVLAFLTPSSLLDSFLYAPVRQALLETLALREVIDLGPGQFRHARVSTCLTVWTSRGGTEGGASHADRAGGARGATFEGVGGALSSAVPLAPAAPSWLLRAADEGADALDAKWRAEGEELTTLIPVSFPGLKTRFDSLLVAADPDRLFERVDAFLSAQPEGLEEFAGRFGIAAALLPKLLALKAFVPEGMRAERGRLRPFIRYAGARHRSDVPREAWAWCYLDRRLIPRGDHRLQSLKHGLEYDPHREPRKLLFNVRERPLSAAVVREEGCVHAHRHSRFAPLFVPRALRDGQRREPVDPTDLVANLSPSGLRWAAELGSPLAVFERVCRFINGEEVQRRWAPSFATNRILPVPPGEIL